MSTSSECEAIPVKSVILVHGCFVDGSGWEAVYQLLRRDGYEVSIVQNSTLSLDDDVARTRHAIAAASGEVILVGHSYGGFVITEAGADPKVVGLVYISALAPDAGESAATLIARVWHLSLDVAIVRRQDGCLLLDRGLFSDMFAADVVPAKSEFMADSQVPWGPAALNGVAMELAWKTKPSWYLVTRDDRVIPCCAQYAMSARAGSTTIELNGGHAIYISQPSAVAELIEAVAEMVRIRT